VRSLDHLLAEPSRPGWNDGGARRGDFVRGTTSILKAVKSASIKRVLWVGGAGGLEAATLYGIGARLDAEPELLFGLRKVDAKELIARAGEGGAPVQSKSVAPRKAKSANRVGKRPAREKSRKAR
jgi:hypothetical protein